MMRMYLVIVGCVVTLITLQAIHYIEFQSKMQSFAAKGPRFTAMNGQELCERIRAIEKSPQGCFYYQVSK